MVNFRNSLLLLGFLLPFHSSLWAQKILIIPIQGVIDLGVSAFVKRSLEEAQAQEIDKIILEMDTPGGRVDAADIISEELMRFQGETTTFVLNWAWSAGSMIALATNRIIMAPGSSIGSAEPREGLSTSEIKDEKIVSALRARFKAIAEEKGHNPALAQAMVDKDLLVKYVEINQKRFILSEEEIEEKAAIFGKEDIKVISTISEKGKLLNLSYRDAEKYGLAEAICKDRETLLMYLEEEGTEIVEAHPSWSENLVRFITHPLTSSLLLGIGFWAIILALRMPGLGAPEVVGSLFILLFFWGHKLAGLAEWTDALLILLGITLLLVEIFALPGFGIVGGAGILSLIAGIVLALLRHPFLIPREELQRASHILVFSFTITLVLFLLSLKFLPRIRLWQNIVLPAQSKSRIENIRLEAKEGIAVSDLRPSGKARFNDKIYDVQTDGEYVRRGEKVKLLSIEGNIIKVRKI